MSKYKNMDTAPKTGRRRFDDLIEAIGDPYFSEAPDAEWPYTITDAEGDISIVVHGEDPENIIPALISVLNGEFWPEWQPMETAPKDGRSILFYVEEYWIEGWWNQRYKKWEVITLDVHGGDCRSRGVVEPDGWMPLPEVQTNE